MHYYTFHIKDYHLATTHLTLEQDACYRRILDMYYDSEGNLPPVNVLARKIRAPEQMVLEILQEFFKEIDGQFYNHRADLEIEAYHKKSEGGKKGAEIRWAKGKLKDTYSSPIANPLLSQCPPNANHEPITNSHDSSPPPVAKPSTKGSRVPKDFQPNETAISLATSLGIDWEAEVEKFIDHHAQKGTIGKDWQAGFRTWLRRSVEFGTAKKVQKSIDGSLMSSAIC